jgi:hypothetical protein
MDGINQRLLDDVARMTAEQAREHFAWLPPRQQEEIRAGITLAVREGLESFVRQYAEQNNRGGDEP